MLGISYKFCSICINDIYILQPKVHFQLLDIVFELKIPNKLSLAFISEISQRCFFEAFISESAGG